MKLDTSIQDVSVEIEGVQYRVAPKTIEIARRLFEGLHEGKLQEKPQYEVWLGQLRILLGAEAVAQLFPEADIGNINLDRLEAIYMGVSGAFDYNGQKLRETREQSDVEYLNQLASTLTVIADKIQVIYDKYPGISRPSHD